ncbi:GntR family transcriptional regulator [Rhodopseudomonas sp. RCAM05734]|uniref:GntR family transcriptional regulator n=1 Tax=Rhodopseudomonas sp. RCAM05734 TaxID=3457549 RepID=UPI00404411E4
MRGDKTVQAQKQSVHEYAVATLRRAIVDGEYAPGQRLVEADMQLRLGVSRPAVREALRQLEAEKLVTCTPFKGTSVSEITWEEAEEIYEVRELLEGHATFRFATRAKDNDLRRLTAAAAGFDAAMLEPAHQQRLVNAAHVFFDIILEGSGSRVICDVLRGLSARISLLRFKSMSLPGRARQSSQEMHNIAAMLQAGDPVAARQAAEAHVRQARAAALAIYETSRNAPLQADRDGPASRRRL